MSAHECPAATRGSWLRFVHRPSHELAVVDPDGEDENNLTGKVDVVLALPTSVLVPYERVPTPTLYASLWCCVASICTGPGKEGLARGALEVFRGQAWSGMERDPASLEFLEVSSLKVRA